MRKADMIDIRDILRLRHALGLARSDIAAALGVSAGTVSNILKRAEAASLSRWPLPEELDDAALRNRLYPQARRDRGADNCQFRSRSHRPGRRPHRACRRVAAQAEPAAASEDGVVNRAWPPASSSTPTGKE